jgi:hypothetical protein
MAETLLKCYTAAEKMKTTDEVLGVPADKLLPERRRVGETDSPPRPS